MTVICTNNRFLNPLVGKSPIYDNITIGKSYECPSTQYGFNDIDIDKMTGRRVPIIDDTGKVIYCPLYNFRHIEIHRNSILESIGI